MKPGKKHFKILPKDKTNKGEILCLNFCHPSIRLPFVLLYVQQKSLKSPSNL